MYTLFISVLKNKNNLIEFKKKLKNFFTFKFNQIIFIIQYRNFQYRDVQYRNFQYRVQRCLISSVPRCPDTKSRTPNNLIEFKKKLKNFFTCRRCLYKFLCGFFLIIFN
jgi:hypothetical protein